MTAQLAQTKLNDVYDFLISFEGMINPDNIRFSRWLKDAQALRKSNPAEGFLMEALVYRAQGKLDKAVDYVKKSYQFNKVIARNDYATLLSNAGRFEEAVELALKNLQEDNFSSNALARLIIDSSIILDKSSLSEGLKLFKDPNRKHERLLHLGYIKVEECNAKIPTLEQANIKIDSLIEVSSIATRAVNHYYLGNSQVSMSIQNNEVGSFFIMDEKISNVDINDCFMIHEKYTKDLIDSDLSFKDYKRIVYSFLPLEKGEILEESVHEQGISA